MELPRRVLIAGGSGMIGHYLTESLLGQGVDVVHLTRGGKKSSVKAYLWNPDKGTIDNAALNGVDVIVNLSGVGIADARWNDKYKRAILFSRTESTRLLVRALRDSPGHSVRALVSASGISYYGLDQPPRGAFDEDSAHASDFMADVAVQWEREAHVAESLGIRVVAIRTGVVLTSRGGALEKLAQPVRLFVGAPLGSGAQYVNWIHIDDLCNLYVRAIADEKMAGPFNAVAPTPVTNHEITRAIAQVLERPLWLPPVPGFAVYLIAGEVASVVLKGGKVVSRRLPDAGFAFRFTTPKPALEDLLGSRKG